MLKKRIITTLLWDGTSLVKGKQFRDHRKVGSMMQAIRMADRRQIDELVILDISATPEGRGPLFEKIKEFTAECFMPVSVGGGVRSCDDIRRLLGCGADKIVLKSALSTGLASEAAIKFGSQAIVAALDCRCSGWSPQMVELAKKVASDGAGEILLTSVPHEGMMDGYNLDLIEAVSGAVGIPVIAHGGCGTSQHALDAFEAGAHAVAVGSAFLFTDLTPSSMREYLHKHGIPMRIERAA